MANEIQHASVSGLPIYVTIETPDGSIWNGSAFVAYSAAAWASYAVAMTERPRTGKYYGAMPSVPAGRYAITPYLRTNASAPAALGDLPWGDVIYIDWGGTAVASVAGVSVRAEITESRNA